MKIKLFVWMLLLFVLVSLVSAQFVFNRDANGLGNDIYNFSDANFTRVNATNITGAFFFGDGSGLTNVAAGNYSWTLSNGTSTNQITNSEVVNITSGNGNCSIALANGGIVITCLDTTGSGGSQWTLTGPYLYNNSGSLDINQTALNNTIDARDSDTTYTASTAYLFLSGTTFGFNDTVLNNTIDARDTDTTYTAGSGLILSSTTFSLNESWPQNWTTLTNYPSACSAGFFVTAVGDTITCAEPSDFFWDITTSKWLYNNSGILEVNETLLNDTIDARDSDTTYTNGTGLNLTSTTFNILVPYRLPQGCSNGQIAEVDSNGEWQCGDDNSGGGGTINVTNTTSTVNEVALLRLLAGDNISGIDVVQDGTGIVNVTINAIDTDTDTDTDTHGNLTIGNTTSNNITNELDTTAIIFNITNGNGTASVIKSGNLLYVNLDIFDTDTDTDTQLSNETVQDIIGNMLSGNTETLITVTYQDGDGTIDFAVTSTLSSFTNDLNWINSTYGNATYEGLLVNEAGLYAALSDVTEFIETGDAATLATLDTGQGANELYAMNQDVETTDNVTFVNATVECIFFNSGGKICSS